MLNMSKRRVGRPRGRKLFPLSVSMTQEQIDWLNTQPNASELIRKLLDSMMEAKDLTPEYARMLELKSKLDALEAEAAALRQKRTELIQSKENLIHFKGSWYHDPAGRWRNYTIENPDDPEPIDEKGKILKKLAEATVEEIERVEAEIERVKSELMK
jgi:hypothetical protein